MEELKNFGFYVYICKKITIIDPHLEEIMENWTLIWTKLTSLKKTNINTIPTKTAGAYRLSYKHEDGNYYIYFVGESADLRKTLMEHLDNEVNACLLSYNNYDRFFRYAIISEEYVRKATIGVMYNNYKPACNEVIPLFREDIIVNLN